MTFASTIKPPTAPIATVDRPSRGATIAGTASAVALFLAVATLNVPNKVSDRELVDWWAKSGNRISALISMYLMMAAALLFLGLLPSLRRRMAAATPDDNHTAALVHSAGLVYAVGLVIAAAGRGVIARAVTQHDEPLPGVDMLRYLPQLSSAVLGVVAMGAAALLIGAVSVAAFRHGAVARWLGVVGVVVTLLLVVTNLAGVGELGDPVVAIWLVATSLHLRRSATAASHVTTRAHVVGTSAIAS